MKLSFPIWCMAFFLGAGSLTGAGSEGPVEPSARELPRHIQQDRSFVNEKRFEEPLEEASPPSPTSDLNQEAIEQEVEEEEESESQPIIRVFGRIDTAYLSGSPEFQGFYLPSVRLGAKLRLSPYVVSRLELGQTREFSSVLLPQMLPVDAYVDIRNRPLESLLEKSVLEWRLGLFRADLNPWWTPPLGSMDQPRFHRHHSFLLMSRDIGTRLRLRTKRDVLHLSAGFFNGNGLIAQNTNNSFAATGYAELNTYAMGLRWTLGGSVYWLKQSTPASVNFQYRLVWNAFFGFQRKGYEFFSDFTVGSFRDSTASWAPKAMMVGARIPIFERLKLYGKYEWMKDRPTTVNSGIEHYGELGTIFNIRPEVQGYTTFSYLQQASGVETSTLEFRLRLLL